jgi:hypothetical protein
MVFICVCACVSNLVKWTPRGVVEVKSKMDIEKDMFFKNGLDYMFKTSYPF